MYMYCKYLYAKQYEGSALEFQNLPLPIGNAIWTLESFNIIVFCMFDEMK